MFRSALAWTLTAAFLATLPVAGAGQCPCRFVKTLHTSGNPAAAAAKTRKCCQSRPAVPDNSKKQQKPRSSPAAPADAPCDCPPVVDAGVATAAERSGHARGGWDANAPGDAGRHPDALFAADPPTVSVEPAGALRPGGHLFRYSHSFRC